MGSQHYSSKRGRLSITEDDDKLSKKFHTLYSSEFNISRDCKMCSRRKQTVFFC